MSKEKKWERQTIDILSKLFCTPEDNTCMKKREQVRASGPARAGVGLIEKVKFERLKRGDRVSHVDIQGKKTPGRGHSKCKDPEVGLWQGLRLDGSVGHSWPLLQVAWDVMPGFSIFKRLKWPRATQ